MKTVGREVRELRTNIREGISWFRGSELFNNVVVRHLPTSGKE
jgi:hypothetical protein